MENFETIMVKFKYEGVEYSFYVHGDEVTGDTDTLWGYWLHTNNYTFQVVGDMVGDTPIYFNNLRVFVYPRGKYEDYDRIGEITEVYSQFVEEKDTKTFKDLKKGDAIYYTNGWDLYKLTISEVVINVDEIYFFYFDQDDEYFRLNSGYKNNYECITRVLVPYEKLCEFALVNNCYDGKFWADRVKCKEFVEYSLEKAQKNIDKVSQSYYKWTCNASCSGGEMGWTTKLINSENTYETKEECYSAMREDAMNLINSFKFIDSEMKGQQKVVIEFHDDAIWVNVGDDIHYTYNVVEC